MRNLISFLKEAHAPGISSPRRLHLTPLQGDGSDRWIFRLFLRHRTVIAVTHPGGRQGDPSENDSFVYIARHLLRKGIPVPRIFAFDRRRGCFLLEDFGDLTLASHLQTLTETKETVNCYKNILDLLVNIQINGALGFETRYCYDTPLFNSRFTWERESLYFLRAFWKGYLGYPDPPEEVEKELRWIAGQVDQEEIRGFLYRDFQSRNIMVQGDRFGFLDFQGGRLGPPQYDLASLLIDPYVDLSWAIQEELLEYYLKIFPGRTLINLRDFKKNYEWLAFQRNLQILGAYGFLSRVKGKTYFEEYIPAAVKNLKKRMTGKLFRPFNKLRRFVEEL